MSKKRSAVDLVDVVPKKKSKGTKTGGEAEDDSKSDVRKTVTCKCGEVCIMQKTKYGKNKGRGYYVCPKAEGFGGPDGCGYFAFADEMEDENTITVIANAPLAAALKEISDCYYRIHQYRKGSMWKKAAKEIRQCAREIKSGRDAGALPGIGKVITAQVNEFFLQGHCPLAKELTEYKESGQFEREMEYYDMHY